VRNLLELSTKAYRSPVHFERAAHLLTRDEARRIAANIAELPKAAVVAGQLLAAPVSRSFAGFRWCTAQTGSWRRAATAGSS
jgi:hypothetical protein